jgi:N-acetylglutamate synthase-like GNAT family acetyltransferase
MRFYGFADDASGLFGFAALAGNASVHCRPTAVGPEVADIAIQLPRLSRPEGPALLGLATSEARARGYQQLLALAEPAQRDWYRRHGFAATGTVTSPVMVKRI